MYITKINVQVLQRETERLAEMVLNYQGLGCQKLCYLKGYKKNINFISKRRAQSTINAKISAMDAYLKSKLRVYSKTTIDKVSL